MTAGAKLTVILLIFFALSAKSFEVLSGYIIPYHRPYPKIKRKIELYPRFLTQHSEDRRYVLNGETLLRATTKVFNIDLTCFYLTASIYRQERY